MSRATITENAVTTARRLAAEGTNDVEIAAVLGCHPKTVRRLRRLHGIPGGGWTPLQVVAYAVNPDKVDDVAVDRLMHGDQVIPLYLLTRANGRRFRGRPPLSPDTLEAIRRLAAAGLNDTEIAARMRGRLTAAGILKIRRRKGIPSGYRLAVGAA